MAIKTLRVFQEFTSEGYVPMPIAGNIDYGVTIAGTFPGTTPATFQTDDPDIDVTLTATTDYYVWIRSHGTDWNPMYTRNVRVYPDSPLVNNVVMGIIIANLSNTVPYVGATTNVDLGTYGLKADYLQLNTSPTSIPTTEGTIAWNSSDGTANLRLKGGTINLQVGEDSVARVVNGTASNLLRADYKVVKIIGAQGQRLQVGLALANNDANSKDTIGLVAENINNNQEGFIITLGVLDEINTTGSLQGETWLDGDTLYLSGTTAGKITNIKPQAPTHTIILGFVAYAHANHGKIYVKVDNGYELDELHNVKITSVANKNTLVYDSATSVWKNRNIFGTQGYVPYYDDTLLMKNSVIFTDGSQVIIGDDTEFSVGNKLSVVGNIAVDKNYGYHSGLYQILFRQDATGEFRIGTNAANDYTTFYANGTERVRISPSGFLGVGLTNPTSILHVKGTTAYTNAIIDNNSASGGGYYSAYQNGAEKAIFGVSGAWLLDNSSDAALIAKGVGQGIQFYTNGSTSEKMGINSDGNVFVGQTPTYVAGATQLVVRGKTGAGFVGVNHYDMSIKGFMNTFNSVFQVGTSTFHSLAFLVEDIERGRVNSSGRLLWGTTTDNTTDLVQINGSLIATSLKKSGGLSTQFLKADGSVDSTTYGLGSVTSVALSAPTGFSISGSPITSSGTLALGFAVGYSLPSDATQATWTAKQNALNGTGFVKIVGTTISYDNSTYYLASNPSGYISGITSLMVTNALGYTPYNATNPSGYISGNQTITLSGDVSGSGATAITTTLATITQASSGSFVKITLDTKGRVIGNVAVGSSDIISALGYTPYNSSNPSGYISGITSGMVTTALGYTPVTNARQLTINGTTYDLSADRSWTISGTIGGLTSGYIPKATSASTLGNSLIYDNGSGVGVGTLSPIGRFDVVGSTASSGIFSVNTDTTRVDIQSYNKPLAINRQGNNVLFNEGGGNVGIGTASPDEILTLNRASSLYARIVNTSNSVSTYWGVNGTEIYFGSSSNSPVTFYSNSTERMRLTLGGNLLVGTTTDSGYKLNVSGTGNFSGELQSQSIRLYKNGSDAVVTSFYQESISGTTYGNSMQMGANGDNQFWNYNGGWFKRLTISNTGNLGLGVTPSAWSAGLKALQIGSQTALVNNSQYTYLSTNWDGNGDKYLVTGYSTIYRQQSGEHAWFTAPSGTAGTAISFTQAMTLDASGNLLVGTTNSGYGKLGVYSASNTLIGIANSTSYAQLQQNGADLYINTNLSGAAGGNLIFRFGASSTEAMRIASSTNVLIGTTTDSGYKLDVNGTGRFSGAAVFSSSIQAVTGFFQSANTDSVVDIFSLFNPSSTSSGVRQKFANGYGDLAAIRVSQRDNGALADDGQMQFQVASNSVLDTKMTILNTGNVGIGTTSPATKLEISQSTDNTDGPTLRIANNANTLSNGQLIGAIDFYNGDDSGTGNAVGAYIRSYMSDAVLPTSSQYLSFATGGTTERMRITSGGNVLIGTTTDVGYKLTVNGDVAIPYNYRLRSTTDVGNSIELHNGSGVMNFYTNGTARLSLAYGGAATFSSSVSGTIFYSTGATSVNSGLSIEPSGWNGTKHRFSVPVSGDASILSYNWNGTARDNVSYGSSVIGLTQGQVTIGVGTGNPTTALTLASTGAATFSSSVTATSFIKTGGTSSQYLMADGSVTTSSGSVGGSGTTNYISKWNGTTSLANSQIFDNGTQVTVGSNVAMYKFAVNPVSTSYFGIGFTGTNSIFVNAVDSGFTSVPIVNNAISHEWLIGFGSAMLLTSSLNLLIGTTTGVSGGGKLQVNGDVNINGNFKINGTVIGGGGGSGITGSGTTNMIAKWTGGTSLGDSALYDNGAYSMGIGTTSIAFPTDRKGLVIRPNGANSGEILLQNSGNTNGSTDGFAIANINGDGVALYNRINAHIRFGTNNTERLRITEDGNLGFGTTSQFGGGVKVIGIANSTTIPNTTPSGGGILFVQNGALKYMGSNGTYTTIANA